MLVDYTPIVILSVAACGIAGAMLLLSHLSGPRRPSASKLSVYESGSLPVGDARLRFSVKFYIMAMLFIVFDIEVVFLYPWAIVYRELLTTGRFILVEMVVFAGVLLLGLAYVWRKGGLEWE